MRPLTADRTSGIPSAALCLAALLTSGATAAAEDIATLDGKHYLGLTDVVDKPSGITFTANGEEVRIPFRKLPLDAQLRHHHNPLLGGLAIARQNAPTSLAENAAFHLKDLEKAKAKAIAEGKPLGFILVWSQFFVADAHPMGSNGGGDYLADFMESWRDCCVFVFVHHETELGQLPAAVQKGILGPDEGGFAPNLCVTDSTCTDYICEIPCGGGSSNGAAREAIFRLKMDVIATWLETHPLADPHGLAAMSATASPAGSATAAAVARAPAPAPGQAQPPAPAAGAAPAPKPSASGVDAEP